MDSTKKEMQKSINHLERMNKQLEDRSKVKYLKKLEHKIKVHEKKIDDQGETISELREHIVKLEHDISVLE